MGQNKLKILLKGGRVKQELQFASLRIGEFTGKIRNGRLLNFEIEMKKEKRKAFRTYVTEQTGLTSSIPLKSPTSPSPQFNSPSGINKPQFSMLKIIESASLINIFKRSITRFKGTNQPVAYRPQYDFSEKWQETSKTKYERNSNLLLSGNALCYFIAILVMIHKIPLIWQLSIYKIFQMEECHDGFLIGIVFLFIDLLLKLFLLQSELSKNTQKMESRKDVLNMELLSVIRGEVICISIFVLDMTVPESGNYEIILDMMAIYFQFLRFLEIYSSITILLITYKYKNYVNLFNFISKIFVMLHFLAILVYSVTLLHPGRNWLLAIGQEASEPMTRYIYSLYFTGTTMFTVGYGDILPTNNLQMLMIIIVQIVGIVLIGYIVSEIGHTLSLMRQAREDFQQDIQNTDTVCEYYQLNQDLKQRVRNYIVNHQLANEELNINEENHFLMKLNEQLRNEVKHANQLNIIKTSLFFICNWSKKMQRELAKKLQKCIFSPNERIVNKDSLYIVTKGKIDVYTQNKFGNKVYCKKNLLTIQRDPSKQVFSNVFGYASLFTGKASRLTAVSKDFAICYALEFSDILDIVRDDQRDFEYYHQRKARLELQRFPETYEIPDLINNRQHYCPTRWLILKKFKGEIYIKQQRFVMIRNNRRKKRIMNRNTTQEIEQDSDSEVLLSQGQLSKNLSSKNKQNQSKKAQNKSKLQINRSIVSFRSYRRRNYHKTMHQQRFKENQVINIMSNYITLTSLFEVGKNYNRYFKKGNRDIVLKKINEYTIKDFNAINSKIMSLEWIDLLIFGNKIGEKKRTQQIIKM